MSRVHEYYENQAELFDCKKCGDEHEVYEPADFFHCPKDKPKNLVAALVKTLEQFKYLRGNKK